MKKLLLLTFILVTSCSTFEVSRITGPSTSAANGIIYSLPKIEYDVVVTYEETTAIVSEYLKEASFEDEVKKIIGFEYINKYQTSFKIKSIELKPVILPDPDNQYFIEFKKRNSLFLKKKFLLELAEQGYLKNANIQSEDYTAGFVFATIGAAVKTVAPIFTPAIKKGGGGSSVALIVGKILGLQKQSIDLISGGLSPGLSYGNTPVQFMYEKLKSEEEELKSLLAGSVDKKTSTKIFRFNPTSLGRNTIFYFSSARGIEAGPGSGISSVEIEITDNSLQTNTAGFTTSKNALIKDSKKGLFYRIPKSVLVRVGDGSQDYWRKLDLSPQLGVTAFLPNRIGLIKNDINYALDPTTGALIKYDANSEGLKLDEIKAMYGDISSSLPDVLKKKEQNEFEQQEKQIKQLELSIKEAELTKKLDSLTKK